MKKKTYARPQLYLENIFENDVLTASSEGGAFDDQQRTPDVIENFMEGAGFFAG